MKYYLHCIELYIRDSIHISVLWYAIAGGMFLLLFAAGLLLAKHKKLTVVQAFAVSFLSAYFLLVLASVVLCRAPLADYRFELRPFWSYVSMTNGKSALWKEIVINVAMFVPLGLLLPLCSRYCRLPVTLLSGFCLALFTELLQLVLRRGIFELDDILNNLLGALIGYALFRCVKEIYNRHKTARDKQSAQAEQKKEKDYE